MSRAYAEQVIEDLYGTDTDAGRELLLKVVDTMGLSALTDEAVHALAEVQQTHERREYAL